MLFNSLEFIVFFSTVYILYLLFPHRLQNRWLLLASYFFYGWWDWRFLFLLLLSTSVDFFCGLQIHGSDSPRARKRYLFLSIIANLGILGFFKYYGFFIESFSRLTGLAGLGPASFTLRIVLPVGISFYTFQTMSYTIDIYRRRMQPTKDFFDFALFVSFFPQLVAGPIERARRLLPQISAERVITGRKIKEGLYLVSWGMFKKVVIADSIAVVVNRVFGQYSSMSCLDVLIAVMAFNVQLFCDFSGYSDIARGLAGMMGFELMVNFRPHYYSKNPVDVWKRWHISLSSWVRDYIWAPLGANRKGSFRTVLNGLLSMALMGLWHGASWHFVLWGVYFGAVQVGFTFIKPWIRNSRKPGSKTISRLQRTAGILITNMITHISLLFFRAESLPHVWGLVRTLFSTKAPTSATLGRFCVLLFLGAPVFIMQTVEEKHRDPLVIMKKKAWVRFAVYAGALAMALLVYLFGMEMKIGEAFIYFQF